MPAASKANRIGSGTEVRPSELPEWPGDEPAVTIEPLLDDFDLERITRRARSTWQKARLVGSGPPFVRIGRLVRYRPTDVRAWLAAQASFRSTSDAPPVDEVAADQPHTAIDRAGDDAEHGISLVGMATTKPPPQRRRGRRRVRNLTRPELSA